MCAHENSDSKILTLAKDVLALTKANWNATQFDQKFPAPLKVVRESDAFLSTSSAGRRSHWTSAVILLDRSVPFTTAFNRYVLPD